MYLGVFNGEKRWRNKERDRIFTWDALHGEIEVFDNRGWHLYVMSPVGVAIKEAVKGRRIDV